MIQFAWPLVFLALPVPWLVRRYLSPAPRSGGAALTVPFFNDVMAAQSDQGHNRADRPRWRLVAAWIAWILLVGAAARPEWLGEPVNLPVSGRDLMLAVDLSGSMERPDFSLGGEQTTRLAVIQAVAGEFIERRVGDRLGLILFGKRAYVQTPLTFDRATVKAMLDEAEIGLAGQETAIGDAIGLAVKRLRERPQQSRVLILLTDGANTAGEVDPLQAAKLANEAGLRIYTVGIGADEMEVQTFFGTRRVDPSADLDEKNLTAIAKTTGGDYFRAKDTAGLQAIYEKLDRLEPLVSDSRTFRPVTTLFYWPLALALLLAAALAVPLSGTFNLRGARRGGVA